MEQAVTSGFRARPVPFRSPEVCGAPSCVPAPTSCCSWTCRAGCFARWWVGCTDAERARIPWAG